MRRRRLPLIARARGAATCEYDAAEEQRENAATTQSEPFRPGRRTRPIVSDVT